MILVREIGSGNSPIHQFINIHTNQQQDFNDANSSATEPRLKSSNVIDSENDNWTGSYTPCQGREAAYFTYELDDAV